MCALHRVCNLSPASTPQVGNKSADYDSEHPGTVRRDGSYIYEEFIATSGTDIKVYTVGSEYAHAEARKSPVVDGKVQRATDGKEVCLLHGIFTIVVLCSIS